MNGFQGMCAKLLPELRETAKERQNMKTVSITTIAAMLLVGCGESQQSSPTAEPKPVVLAPEVAQTVQDTKPAKPKAEPTLLSPFFDGDIEAATKAIDDGLYVGTKVKGGYTLLELVCKNGFVDIAKMLIEKGANVNGATENYPPLAVAILHEQLEVVKLLVNMGADVNRKNRHHPMVMTAVDKDHGLEILKFLLEKGADPNVKDYSGKTSLDKAVEYNYPEAAALLRKHGGESAAGDSIHIAARMGDLEAVKKHIAAGADVNELKSDGITPRTPLHKATSTRMCAVACRRLATDCVHLEIVKLLIAEGANVNIKDGQGSPPLSYGGSDNIKAYLREHGAKRREELKAEESIHEAVGFGSIELVKQFLKDGADVNARGQYGSTPLHRAASSGSKEMIEFLIANGADVNAMNHDETPLDSHWSFGLKEPTERSALLRKHGGKTGSELSIVIAANRRELKTVQQHIANGVDVNTTHDGGVTALHHAVSNRDRKLVQYLIDNGANVNARDESGSTPLEWCEGDKRTSDILRKHGGKTSNELDNKKPEKKPAEDIAWAEKESLSMALFQAAIDGNVDMLKQHLEDGAEINQTGIMYGATPLSMALAGGHLAASKLLIEKGANVNAIVDGGGNLLFFIAPSGKEDLVELLLKNGADVNAKDEDGTTPLHFADTKEIAELLIAAGANVNAKADYGETPLDEAINLENTKTADLLRKHGGKTGEELKAEQK